MMGGEREKNRLGPHYTGGYEREERRDEKGLSRRKGSQRILT